MTNVKYESQFSIYKVDYEEAAKFFSEEKNITIDNYKTLEANILVNISNDISSKNSDSIASIKYNNFNGFVFKTNHYPSWYTVIKSITEEKIELMNTHSSYVLSYLVDDNLFLLTGGLGSGYIKNYIRKNYGLYIIPKITKNNEPMIKSVLENRMLGNRVTSKHSNKNMTTVIGESDMSSIFRELSIDANSDVIKNLGLKLGEKNDKNIGLMAKDSLVIRKSISLDELALVLDTLTIIEKMGDNYSLGYFVDARKKGYSYQVLNSFLVNYIAERKLDNFIFYGGDYCEYYVSGNKYIIKDQNNEEIYSQDYPIDLRDLLDNCLSEKCTKTSIEKLLKCTLTVYSDSDIILFPTKLKECINGYIEDDKNRPFIISNGNWYMFDGNYLDNLSKEFKKIYEQITDVDDILSEQLSNNNRAGNEDAYNKLYSSSINIIAAHTVRSGNIEIADLIYYDDETLYLVHNKNKFQGAGVRDVLNQVLVSADYINQISFNKKEILELYYDKICNTYPNNQKVKSISKEDFSNLFSTRKIVYVAGFMEHFSEHTGSNYAKYLTIDIYKKLKEKGIDLLLFNINS